MLAFKCTLLFIAYFALRATAGKAPFITPCTASDKECITKSANAALPYFIKGIPELNVPAVEPIILKDYSTKFGDLEISFTNMEAYELGKAKLINVERIAAGSSIKIDIETPIRISGKYKCSGQIFNFALEGEGDVLLTSDKIVVNVAADLETLEKDGESYWNIKDMNYEYEFKDKLNISLDNLFGGDKSKAEPALKTLNENWEILVAGIGNPIIKNVVEEIAFVRIGTFLDNVSLKELVIA